MGFRLYVLKYDEFFSGSKNAKGQNICVLYEYMNVQFLKTSCGSIPFCALRHDPCHRSINLALLFNISKHTCVPHEYKFTHTCAA